MMQSASHQFIFSAKVDTLTLECVTHCVLLTPFAVCNVILTLECVTLASLTVCDVILTLECVTFVTFVTF